MEYSSNFPYAWRLTDEKYVKLTKEEISLVTEQSVNESIFFWNERIINRISYFPINEIYKNNETAIADCGWGDELTEDVTKNLLREMFLGEDCLRFYWDYKHSVSVSTELFIKYWSDFCYPSDAGNVIYLSPRKIYIYYEDILLLGKKE